MPSTGGGTDSMLQELDHIVDDYVAALSNGATQVSGVADAR